MMTRFVGVLAEDFQHKFVLVVEGQQMLVENIDRVEVNLKQEIQKVAQRVTAVAADLTAYRFATEAHRWMYGVRKE